MLWPGEKEYEGVGKGTGLEIRTRVEEQLESEVDMWVVKEGTIPVFKEIVEDEVYEDAEFTVKPWKEKIFKPEYKDWSLFCSVRDPNYQQRMGHAFWLAENKRWDDFVLGWFRDAKIPGSEGFKEELEAQVRKAIQKWKDNELLEWSAEDDDPEEIQKQGIERAESKIWKWTGQYWWSHSACQQIPVVEFQKGAVRLWKMSTEMRIDRAVTDYQEEWTERRQAILTEELEEMGRSRMEYVENRWERILQRKEFKAIKPAILKKKAYEIRAEVMVPEEIGKLALKVYRYLCRNRKAGEDIRGYLEVYGDLKMEILAQLKAVFVQSLLEVEEEHRMEEFKDLLMVQSVEEEECGTHNRHQCYRVWWLAATKGAKFTRADLEWMEKNAPGEDARWMRGA
jgi:hypothetical protein